jgi:ATP-dependent RNA helicase DeaD
MEQPERNRALAAFRKGELRALVATDVAARGIDVQDITRVIHAEPPTDADTYTHRSGRTGRAGRKGTSSVLVAPESSGRASQLLQRARVQFRFEPIPTAEQIKRARDEHLYDELTRAEPEGAPAPEPRVAELARRLAGSDDPVRTIGRLLALAARATGPEPRELRAIEPPAPRARPTDPRRPREGAPARQRSGERREWVPFRVSWGQEHGADARRLLAVMCRRGGIRGSDVGAIRVARVYSVVEVGSDVAEKFAAEARKPDPRDPRVLIKPDRGVSPASGAGARAPKRKAH